jgi:hypothetical protein
MNFRPPAAGDPNEFFEVLHLTRDPAASAGNGPDGARRDYLVARFDRYLTRS